MTEEFTPHLNIITIEQPEHQSMLTTPASVVEFPLKPNDVVLITAMKEKLGSLGGVGLAAPQVNKSLRIITIYIPEDAALLRENAMPQPMQVLINPSYEAVDETNVIYDFEACYSVSEKAGEVPRFEHIQVNYQDETGLSHQMNAEGFYARVLQHEIDHLNGILFIDKLPPDSHQGSIEEIMVLKQAQ